MKTVFAFSYVVAFFIYPSFSFANSCKPTLVETVKTTANRSCKDGVQEVMTTDNHMVSQSGKALEQGQYGFYFRCQKGETYIGLAKVAPQKKKDDFCKVTIASVSRVNP